MSKNDRTKGRSFNESIKTKTKQNKTNVTPEKDSMASAEQTPGGYKFAPLVAIQQGRACSYRVMNVRRSYLRIRFNTSWTNHVRACGEV